MQDTEFRKGFKFDHVWPIIKFFVKFLSDSNPPNTQTKMPENKLGLIVTISSHEQSTSRRDPSTSHNIFEPSTLLLTCRDDYHTLFVQDVHDGNHSPSVIHAHMVPGENPTSSHHTSGSYGRSYCTTSGRTIEQVLARWSEASPPPDQSAQLEDIRRLQEEVACLREDRAVGTITEAVGTITEAVGTITEAVGTITEAVGTITEAVGTITEAVGTITEAVGTITRAVGNITEAVGTITRAVGTITRAVGRNHHLKGKESVAKMESYICLQSREQD
ncbi:hypothetical protein F511_16072 [Dorcoceras hygrometricum]|uniref:Uncharacterized protein n=1 Tax=Dorcoceras hygrometricum TaxID=472368 RepID=A0A2Z7A476_9LAMI|nr:hypothetical protein F511_16072 [Dorcoceras hygrometricum]